jgi:hypothetical protein
MHFQQAVSRFQLEIGRGWVGILAPFRLLAFRKRAARSGGRFATKGLAILIAPTSPAALPSAATATATLPIRPLIVATASTAATTSVVTASAATAAL